MKTLVLAALGILALFLVITFIKFFIHNWLLSLCIIGGIVVWKSRKRIFRKTTV